MDQEIQAPREAGTTRAYRAMQPDPWTSHEARAWVLGAALVLGAVSCSGPQSQGVKGPVPASQTCRADAGIAEGGAAALTIGTCPAADDEGEEVFDEP